MRQRIFWALAFVAVVPFLLGNLAKAQSDIQPAFTPTIDQKLDARSVPTKVTSDDESSLISKGYVKIGTISASQPGKKENPEITRQLESAILQKAAEAGGDVVRFISEGEGTVWRYDPKLAADIAFAKRGVNNLSSFLSNDLANLNPKKKLAEEELAGILMADGDDVNVKDDAGDTALLKAASSGKKELAEMLLAHGADVNARDNDGWTPLLAAANGGYTELAELFLAHGADVNAKDQNGLTPLHLAVRSPEGGALKDYKQLAELLLARGADVNARDNDSRTPLHMAQIDAAKVLLAHGADVNARDNNGETPLHNAASGGNTDVAELLLAHGANINSMNNNGETPLRCAVKFENKSTAELLRQHGGHK